MSVPYRRTTNNFQSCVCQSRFLKLNVILPPIYGNKVYYTRTVFQVISVPALIKILACSCFKHSESVSHVLNEFSNKYVAVRCGHFAFTMPIIGNQHVCILGKIFLSGSGWFNLLLAVDKIAFIFIARHIYYGAKSVHWSLIVPLLPRNII